MRWAGTGLCLSGLAATAACSLFQPPPPPAPLPVRLARTTLPVLELAASDFLIGRCLNYRPEGTYRTEPCPPGVSEALGPTGKQRFDSGQHSIEVLWVKPSADGPPGFRGDGGYFHAAESHILEAHFAQTTKAKVKPETLEALDALCRQTGLANDRAIIDRSFGGCALAHRGTAAPGGPPPQVTRRDIATSGDSWGRPQAFQVSSGSATATESPGCQGDLTAVTLSVVRLTDLCHDFVRQWMFEDLSTKERTLHAKLDEVRTKLDLREHALDQAREALAAASPPEEKEGKKAKGDKKATHDAQKNERDLLKARVELGRLRQEASGLRTERTDLETALQALQTRRDLYREEPYLVRPTHDAKTASAELDAPAVSAATP